ncbi:MAG: pyridoxamine 5'-phosphate oxidase family protein [Chloroflexota bacterium]
MAPKPGARAAARRATRAGTDPVEPVSWTAFEAAAPDLAAEARRLLRRGGEDAGLLATVRGDQPPRIHPVNVGVVDGRLYVFVLPSAKGTDLESDGRFALHSHQDPDAPSELSIRGRATLVADSFVRAAVATSWPFEVDASYRLFELRLTGIVIGRRPTAADWPPRYSTWSP